MGPLKSVQWQRKVVFQSFFWWKSRNGQGHLLSPRHCLNVSILLLMEIPKWDLVVSISLGNHLPFQSFFWWKSRNGSKNKIVLLILFDVSILLLMEIPKWDWKLFWGWTIRSAFQSFFWWKSRNGRHGPFAPSRKKTGFNPSFDGNPEMGYLDRHKRIYLAMVSILLLMEIPKWVIVRVTASFPVYCFNPSFDGNPEMGLTYCFINSIDWFSFNPSFDGNPEMGWLPADRGQTAYQVSILLLMEIPKWEWALEQHKNWQTFVSILLLMEIPKWDVFTSASVARGVSFNPSFDGNPEMGLIFRNRSGRCV